MTFSIAPSPPPTCRRRGRRVRPARAAVGGPARRALRGRAGPGRGRRARPAGGRPRRPGRRAEPAPRARRAVLRHPGPGQRPAVGGRPRRRGGRPGHRTRSTLADGVDADRELRGTPGGRLRDATPHLPRSRALVVAVGGSWGVEPRAGPRVDDLGSWARVVGAGRGPGWSGVVRVAGVAWRVGTAGRGGCSARFALPADAQRRRRRSPWPAGPARRSGSGRGMSDPAPETSIMTTAHTMIKDWSAQSDRRMSPSADHDRDRHGRTTTAPGSGEPTTVTSRPPDPDGPTTKTPRSPPPAAPPARTAARSAASR